MAFLRFPFRLTRTHLWLLLALLVATVAAWPVLAQPGILNTRGGGDSPFLLQRLQQLETAVLDGHFPARWMPDANYGYGYPFYNFYAPLSVYIALLFRGIGFSYVRAIHLAQLAGFLVAAAGMFLLARRWLGSDRGGWLAAVAYTVAPFHMVNVYVRGDSLAEFWAMAFYPWVILAVDGVVTCRRQGNDCRRSLAGLALAYAALILSHNISALIFTPFVLLYVLLRTLWGRPSPGEAWRVLRPLAVALILALALAAWFFVAALAERDLAQLEPVTAGYFHYGNHFRGVDLVQLNPIFDYGVDGGNAFRMGFLQAVTAVAGLITLVAIGLRRRNGRPSPAALLFIVLTFVGATFMITPLSRPLWDHLPLLPFTQFPWRFLSVQAFAAALATGALAWLPRRRWLVPLLAGLLLAGALGNLHPDHLLVTDADVTAERLAQYEWFTGNIGTTVSAEYLPPTVQPRPFNSAWLRDGERFRARALAGTLLDARATTVETARQQWQVETAAGATIQFPTLYWPGWVAQLDGQVAALRPSPGSGLITLDVPAGAHAVTLRLARTPVRLATELVSLLALLVTIWLLRPWRLPRQAWPPAAGLLVGVVVLAALVRLWPQRAPSPDDLTWDFAQMGYLHHDAAGVPFSNGLVLESYGYGSDTAVPGATFTVTVQLDGADGSAGTLALTTPASAWSAHDELAPVIAGQTLPLDGRSVTFTLEVPPNAPAGLVVPRFTIRDAQPLTPAGRTRGDLFLRPLHLAAGEAAEVTADRPLDARAVAVAPRGAADGDVLDVALAWFTERPLSRNYNVTLRLLDTDGGVLAQWDGQPGYGFQASSLWPAGAWTNDWLALPLPPALPGDGPYPLIVQLYDVAGEAALRRRLGTVDAQGRFAPQTPTFTAPEGLVAQTAVFGDVIRLVGYTLEQEEDALRLTLAWQALEDGARDYTRFVHLRDASSGVLVAQNDAFPQGNSYPTSQWQAGEFVTESVTLDLSAVPPGEYEVVVGFYEQTEGLPRLPAVTADGTPYPDDSVPLPEQVTITR